MLLYSTLDRILPRSYLAKVLGVVVLFGQGPVLALIVLGWLGYLPEVDAWPLVTAALILGFLGVLVGLRAVLRPVADIERAIAAFEAGDTAAVTLPEGHVDAVGRLMERAGRLIRQAEMRIDAAERLADRDPLTGLLNRRGFERALSGRSAGMDRGALMMLDLDHFKSVNDDHGHDEGDRVLRAVADVLRRQMRRPDLSARFGGEEFVIFLPGVGRDTALRVAERLRMGVEDGISVRQRPQTASIGIALWQPGMAFQDVLKRADEAVYTAKALGRNCVHLSNSVGLDPAITRSAGPGAEAGGYLPAAG